MRSKTMLVDQDIGGIKEEEMIAMDGNGGDANHKYKGVHRSREVLTSRFPIVVKESTRMRAVEENQYDMDVTTCALQVVFIR